MAYTAKIFDSSGYHGVDIDAKRIDYASHLYPDCRFSTIEESVLPASSGTYDYIFVSSVLHHISPEESGEFIKEFYRVLKDEGKIIVIEPCFFRGCNASRLFMTAFDKGKYIRSENEYINMFDKDYLKIRVLNRFSELFFYRKLFFTASKR